MKENKSTPAVIGKNGKKKTWFCGTKAAENAEKAKKSKDGK